MASNGLLLNVAKTKYIDFGSPRQDLRIRMHEEMCSLMQPCSCVQIENTLSHKFLGLWLDSDLKFKTHVNSVQSKVRAGVAVLALLYVFFPRDWNTGLKASYKRVIFRLTF